MTYAILRFAKLKTWGQIAGSLSHNYRIRDTPNADENRTHLNEHSHETTQDVKNDLIARLPQKYRKDAVMCLEHLVTCSPNWDGWGTEKEAEFFEQSKKWLEDRYGKKNVIATSIHRDETTPHLVAYIVPLDPETKGLNAKKWTGGREELSKMQTSFAEQIEHLGIERGLKGSKAEHVPISRYYEKVNSAFDYKIQDNIPTKGLFESTEKYAQKIIESALPNYEKNRVLATETLDLSNENKRLRLKLESADIYFNAVQYLNTKNKAHLDFFIQDESNKLLFKQQKQQAEILAQKQAEQELKDKKLNELTNTFRAFESYHDKEFFKREKIQKDLNNRLKKSEKWLSKNKLSEQNLFETDPLGRSKYETPDFFISHFNYENQYQKSDLDFQRLVSSKVYELNAFDVVSQLRQLSINKKLLSDLTDFDIAVTPVYTAHLKENAKWANDYYETQRQNAQNEREHAEQQKRDDEYQSLVSERMRKTREFERQNSDYASPKKKDQGNDFSP
ncbi:MobV family relaxase [Acinetobacter kyonggiensis]|uniref:Plasmid recombination enzyme n=1 Tax=Acinetobacter kyonggiensis TaxID=595670 RepID=A0A1H3NQ61_9GAMM|nr:MobV family relaxase [Acinetobacter kyonggiensis]SDY90903.1 Plasmid recombination enzyme [Acinetobacter kyonggiensis]